MLTCKFQYLCMCWYYLLKHVIFLSCSTIRLSSRLYQSVGFPWRFIMGRCEICRKIQMWFRIGQSIGHFTWRPQYVLTLTAILTGRKSALIEWHGTALFAQPRRGINITWTCHCVAMYVRRLSCSLVSSASSLLPLSATAFHFLCSCYSSQGVRSLVNFCSEL
jgi:hypothetical protein